MDTLNQWNDLADSVTETAEQLAATAADATKKASQSKPARTMRDASEKVERAVSDRNANALWRSVFLGAAGAAAMASLGMLMINKKHESLYVGQWVPTLLIVALWAQVVRDA